MFARINHSNLAALICIVTYLKQYIVLLTGTVDLVVFFFLFMFVMVGCSVISQPLG